MKPYYEQDGITIYHGDCREVLEGIEADAVVTDPPYGIGAAKNLRANTQHGAAVAPGRDYGAADWDALPAADDLISECVRLGDQSIIWGGNYFSLPRSPCWLIWDKRNGDNGYADCELSWTNLSGAVRMKSYRWMGMLQEYGGTDKEPRFHPTQKPVSVMRWCIGFTTGEMILDPFMGSGTTLRAAKDLGRKAIGIEIEEKYCEIAANRLAQGVLDFAEATA